jgi:hypothetical protein
MRLSPSVPSLFLLLAALSGCALFHKKPTPPHSLTMTTHMNGDESPTTYVITPGHVQATRKNPDGTVLVGSGHDMQEAYGDLHPR